MDVREMITNAEIAYGNRQYEEALKWYEQAYQETPNDLLVLSRLGALCAGMEKYDKSLKYFSEAMNLDPDNGDNAFNYGNACFFNKDNAGAFNAYVKAERLGCSKDVTPKLYYQMGLLFSSQMEVRKALIYFRKCEDADTTGEYAVNTDLISEKLKIYMYLEDYTKAEECAAQLMAAEPFEAKGYMVYFSILAAHRKYEAAFKVLEDAERYADLKDNEKVSVQIEKASLLLMMAEKEPSGKDENTRAAFEILENQAADKSMGPEARRMVLMTLADAYYKTEQYDKAIELATDLLGIAEINEKAEVKPLEIPSDLTPEEMEEMREKEVERINDMIETGELDDDLGAYAEEDYDEEGDPIHIYAPEDLKMEMAETTWEVDTESDQAEDNADQDLEVEVREKLLFTLLSSYLGKEDFQKAALYAKRIQDSSNIYYQYYGRYIEALSLRKLKGATEQVEQLYTETIAFFRNCTLHDARDSIALIFRARMYAEQGKYAKAEELTNLLSKEDRAVVLEYIRSCKA